MVGGVHRRLGGGAEGIAARLHRELRAVGIGAAHERGVARMRRGVETQQVVGVGPVEEALDLLARPVGELGARRRARRLQPPLAVGQRAAAGHRRLGAVIQVAQQLALPAVPHVRPDGADVRHRQHQQQAQALRRADGGDEVLDGARVGDVAVEGGGGAQQVVFDQPRHGLRLLGGEAEPGRQFARDAGAEDGMVAAPPLGDVVQEQRQVQHLARQHLVHDFGRQRQFAGQRALLDPRQDPHREDRVLVDGIDVVHVVLGLRDDAPKAGTKRPSTPASFNRRRVVSGSLRLVSMSTNRRFASGSARSRASMRGRLRVMSISARGWTSSSRSWGDAEQPQHVRRGARERLVVGDSEPPVVEPEALDVAPPAPQRNPQQRAAGVLGLDGGAEDAGEIADRLGDQVVVLHEPLDVAAAGAGGVARLRGDGDLAVEGQALLGAPRQVVEAEADAPQVAVRAPEHAELGLGEHAARHQVAHVLDPVEVFGDPEQRVEVAQPALAVLEVGLHDVARIPHAAVAGVALLQFGGGEGAAAPCVRVGGEAPPELQVERLVAMDEARFQQRGADGDVAPGAGDGLVDRPRRLAHGQAQVPQHVEGVFDDLLAARGGLVGREEQQVDVGERRELAAPVAADRHRGQAVRRRRVGLPETRARRRGRRGRRRSGRRDRRARRRRRGRRHWPRSAGGPRPGPPPAPP